MESQISELEEQIEPKKALLNKQYHLKSILCLKHNELRDRCMAVLNEMDIQTLEDVKGKSVQKNVYVKGEKTPILITRSF